MTRATLGLVLVGVLVAWAPAPPEAPIAEAAMRGDLAQVQALIAAGEDVNASLGDGMTALHWAAQRGAPELAGVLIEAGASIDAGTRLGAHTPLHVASRSGQHELVSASLENELLADRPER